MPRQFKQLMFGDERIGRLSAECRILFIGLCFFADKYGRLEYKPEFLKDHIHPFDSWDTRRLLYELEKANLLRVIEIPNKAFIKVTDIEKWLVVGREIIPNEVREEVLSAGSCAECGSAERLEVDHIRPYSKGGSNHVSNLQPLCSTCNRAKSDGYEEGTLQLKARG